MKTHRGLAVAIALLIIFAVFAKGAHDLWAASLSYFVILALSLWLLFNATRSSYEPLRLPFIFPALALAIALSFSFLWAANPSDAFLGLMDWGGALLLFYVGVNVFASDEAVDTLLALLIPCLWAELAVVIWQTTGITEHEKMGTLVNANVLFAFALPWSLVFIGKAILEWNRRRARAFFWFTGAAGAVACLIPTQSGAGVICLLAGMALLLVRYRTSRFIKPVLRYWPWAAAAAVIAVGWIVFDKFTRVYDPVLYPYRDNSNRFYWWKSALLMFIDRPFFGVGVGNFPSAYLAYKVGGKENTLYAHSVPLEWLAETGAIGFSTLLLFFAAWMSRVRAQWRSEKIRQEFVPAIFATLLFYTVSIGPEYLVNLMSMSLLMAITIAPACGFHLRPRLSTFIIGAGAVLAASPFLISPFLASRCQVDGTAHIQSKEWDSARKSFDAAIALDDRSWEPYAGLARVAFEQGETMRAVEFQRKALDRNRLSVPLQRQLEDYQRFLR